MSGFPLESMKQNWRTWPNLFSSLRIALSWLPAYLLVTGSQDATLRWWALITFALIAATDGIDGWLARKLNQTSEWGMFIDPIGDKLLVAFTFIGKVKTVVQFAAVIVWMAPAFDDNMLLRGCVIGMAFGVTIISWAEYYQRYVAHGRLTTTKH